MPRIATILSFKYTYEKLKLKYVLTINFIS